MLIHLKYAFLPVLPLYACKAASEWSAKCYANHIKGINHKIKHFNESKE